MDVPHTQTPPAPNDVIVTPAPTIPMERAERAEATPSRTSKKLTAAAGLYDRAGVTLALLGSLAIAAGLWWVGAYFTLRFLASAGLKMAGTDAAAWLIPMTITAIELWLLSRIRTNWQALVIFLTVLAFDIGTSWGGFVAWGAGRHVSLFAGFTIPTDGRTLHLVAIVLGLIWAFLPEKIARWAVAELRRVWHF